MIDGIGTIHGNSLAGRNRFGSYTGTRTAPGEWSLTNQRTGATSEAVRQAPHQWGVTTEHPNGVSTYDEKLVVGRGNDYAAMSKPGPLSATYTDADGTEVTKTKDGYTYSTDPEGNMNVVTPGGYELESRLDEHTLTMTDPATGESTLVWGDPHVLESDGGAWDYENPVTTFELPDGTKVTTTATSADGTLTDVDVMSADGRSHFSDSVDQGSSVAFDGQRFDRSQADGDVYQARSLDTWA